jgi:tRNA(fMet)-specific endonuclease VapC
MSVVVIDTDVVSFLFKNHPLASMYLPEIAGRTAAISFMTVAELDRWALEAKWSVARRWRLREYIESFVVVPYSRDLCERWAEVTVAAQACGRRIECADAWVAASALFANAPLITHNRRDFESVPGLRLISHSTS